jgi:hypothetical protein
VVDLSFSQSGAKSKKGKNGLDLSEWESMDLEEIKAHVKEKELAVKALVEKNSVCIVEQGLQTAKLRDLDGALLQVTSKIYERYEQKEKLKAEHAAEIEAYQGRLRSLMVQENLATEEFKKHVTRRKEDEEDSRIDMHDFVNSRKKALQDAVDQDNKEHNRVLKETKERLAKEREELAAKLERDLEQMQSDCKDRYNRVKEELELQLCNRQNECKERMHSWLCNMKEDHNASIEKRKSYYNEIIRGQVEDINALKERLAQLHAQRDEKRNELQQRKAENATLLTPLEKVQEEVSQKNAD